MKTTLAILLAATALAAQSTRDVVEFTLFKQKDPVTVNGVGLILKETDVNRQRYKLVLVIGKAEIEQKDVFAQIPIYFYTGSNQERPLELVVTRVSKDQVDGRLVTYK